MAMKRRRQPSSSFSKLRKVSLAMALLMLVVIRNVWRTELQILAPHLLERELDSAQQQPQLRSDQARTSSEQSDERLLPASPSEQLSSIPASPREILQELHREWKTLMDATAQLHADDITQTSKRLPQLQRKVVPNAWNRTCTSTFGSEAITAVTQLGTSKLGRLLLQSKRWDGPVSAAIYITGPDDIETLISFWDEHTSIDSKESGLSANKNGFHSGLCHISLHIVMEYVDPQIAENKDQAIQSFGYPHNIMRNVAMDNSDSDYFATFDADFITFSGAHEKLQKTMREADNNLIRKMRDDRTLLVMPAFDTLDEQHSSLPDTRKATIKATLPDYSKPVVEKLKRQPPKAKIGKVYPFYLDKFPPGHGPTDFPKWFQLRDDNPAEASYAIEYAPMFEPYVIGYLDRSDVRRYHEFFRGFGFNKYTWILNMHCHGYKFRVLRDMIAMHLFHPARSWGYKNQFLSRGVPEFRKFKANLKKKYPQCKVLSQKFT